MRYKTSREKSKKSQISAISAFHRSDMENFQSQVSDVEVDDDDDSEEEKDENDQESQQQEEEGDNEEAAPEGDNDGQQEEDGGEDVEKNDDENDEEEVGEGEGEDDADDDNEDEGEEEEEENEVDQDDTIKDESDVLFVGEKKSVSIDLAANISGDIVEEKKKATKKRKAGTMVGDIQEMMYGFGDTHFPANEDSVALIQSLITNYIEDLTWRAAEVADIRSRDSSGNGRIDKDSFLFLVRKDKAKFNRVFKLLKANDELKAAQKLEIREDHPSML